MKPLNKREKMRLLQDFPEGIPGWMISQGYSEKQIRELMHGRRRIYDPPAPSPDAIPPEHHFLVEPEKWDEAVFSNAILYRVIIGRNPFNRASYEYKTFPEALVMAKTYLTHIQQVRMGNLGRPMIYAVAASGRHTMLVPQRWDHYMRLWVKKLTCETCGILIRPEGGHLCETCGRDV